MLIVGIDCATAPRSMGFACAVLDGNTCRLVDAKQGTSSNENLRRVAGWIAKDPNCLICMDSPLGWPEALGKELTIHAAGQGLSSEANLMFRRDTDREVRRRLKKQSLDVGADRIARTAHSALQFLVDLRRITNERLPLAWGHEWPHWPAVIEVYPAATLVAHGMRSSGYKKKKYVRERDEILTALATNLIMPEDLDAMRGNADALDAVVCVLAGLDFLNGHAPGPTDAKRAMREGWMWVRSQRGIH